MSETTRSERDRRRTLARHGSMKSPSAWGAIVRFLSVAVATVLVAGVGVAAFIATDLTSSLSADMVDIGGEAPPPDIAAYDGPVQILMAGTDVCEPEYAELFQERCSDAEDGVRSDVLMLLNISAAPRKVTVISFPRDLMVPIPECTDANGNPTWEQSKAMINSAFGLGGLACTVATVRELTGQPIQFAASINWGGVIEMTNAIGGVDVCIGADMYDRHTGIDWKAGPRTISGLEALQFLRTRHGVGNGSDLGRISNQQQYMSNLVKKLMSEQVLSNPGTLLRLAKVAVESIDPSTSMADPYKLMQIAMAVKDVPFQDFVFVQYPVQDDPADPNRVIPIYEDADALWAAIASGQSLTVTGGTGGSLTEEDIAALEAEKMYDGDGDGLDDETGEPMPTEIIEPTPEPTDPGTEVPGALPPSVTGTNASQNVCSDGTVSNE
ncbi:LCP family protein [Microbacterium sp. YY-03]|uniref:LCP family protein n=1 Tax=Microbacterium sp. YY-03 TaxID=3421636 RepID=UPI003D175BA2